MHPGLVTCYRLGLVFCLCDEVLDEAFLLLTRGTNWWSLGLVCWATAHEEACRCECGSEGDEGEHVRADLLAGNGVHLNHDGGGCDGAGDPMGGIGGAMAVVSLFSRSSLAPFWRNFPM